MNQEFEPLRLTESQMKEMVAEKINSRDYWIFVPGLEGMQAVIEIERKFFAGGAEDDFKQIVFPLNKTGFYGLAFGVKRRLSPEALASYLRTKGPWAEMDGRPLTSVDLMRGDFICLADAEEAELLTKNVYQWLGDIGRRNDGRGY